MSKSTSIFECFSINFISFLQVFTFKIVRIKDTNSNIIGIPYIPYIKFQIKDIVAVAKAEDICNTLSLDRY